MGRLRQLQTGSPHKLVLVRAFRCPDLESAQICENHLHAAWKHRREEGEWFSLDPLFCVMAAAISLQLEIEQDPTLALFVRGYSGRGSPHPVEGAEGQTRAT